MKNIHKFIYPAFTVFVFLLSGCSKDFLERTPLDSIVDENYYQTDEQVLMGTAALYNIVWFDYNDKASFAVGDARGGTLFSGSSWTSHVRFTTSSTEDEVLYSWRAFFNTIGQCNTIIRNVNKFAGAAVSESIKKHAIAEARFMRGLAYSYLVRNYQAVPIITDNTALLTDTTLTRNTVESVWEFIIRDFRYAAQNLPAIPVAKGRITKWSAEGMLAKMFLTRAGLNHSEGSRDQTDLDSARYYAKDVIDNSGAKLVANYADLFKTANNNNIESLFALQWVYNGEWGTQNTLQAYMAFNSSITGFSDGWGIDHGATADILKEYEAADSIRRKATFMFPGDRYNYIHQIVTNPDGTQSIEELVVTNGNRANVKKYVVGLASDNDGRVANMSTAINTYMLRLAEVYLIYAEAVMGNANATSDAEALKYFNAVRTRAGLAAKTSITFDDIFHEKRIECAMEGVQWYEFVRLYYFNPTKALTILSNMDKGNYTITHVQGSNPPKWNITYNPVHYSVDAAHFFLPYPEVELTQAPNLRKEPIPYTFTEDL
ncbi:RagB/SusD family nutrient uptake outer membrane protein [Cytophagaceae bacterium DM2B3-1]|uniref:RagB/SusD family nutrient uptake outer membrane protein n=1 Tax=Xanthocytophaga flava TaxID=3048013 RepID=A0ABT7CWQ8_9BACT|nr:RagB/SusD family nutrient uptake outer membrane protein [Xanthocytophaga flavus]MDJ1498194.1 RagB/SusD family nutrient uptake outer membrane protein [Xanthocytophaga flavus]